MEIRFSENTKLYNVELDGCYFGLDVLVERDAIINVTSGHIGDRTIIRSGAIIGGNYVKLGRESYLDFGAWIGGGSCFDSSAFLVSGDFLHMGWNSQINIARGVEIGEEVGVGIETKIFTHGAYLPIDFGFPVQWGGVKIGNRVWLPNSWVNPNVVIGDNVVVSARSLINKDLPSGCLAGGVPAKILKENEYPKKVGWQKVFDCVSGTVCGIEKKLTSNDTLLIIIDETIFDIESRTISGKVTSNTEKVKNQLRRNGIRFKYTDYNGYYGKWEDEVWKKS